MRFKDIGKRIGDIAFRLATSTCEGECRKCRVCQISSPPMPRGERQKRGNEARMVKAKPGDDVA